MAGNIPGGFLCILYCLIKRETSITVSMRYSIAYYRQHKKNSLWESSSYLFSLFYRIAFLRAFPAVNPGVFLALMFIGAPVCGFLPLRAALERTMNVPKPVT